MLQKLKKITAKDLMQMDLYAGDFPIRIDLAYAREDNYLFGERIYRKNTNLYLHKDLAKICLKASEIVQKDYNLKLVLFDGLRTVNAQEKMLKTQRVLENPQWLKEPRLLSPPGLGGHPRGMAIDVSLETDTGEMLDMGTPFDFLAQDSSPQKNPAHRLYQHSPKIMENRNLLEGSMLEAAAFYELDILPLPQEWWDFRFTSEVINSYEPLYDEDLPEDMRLCDRI